MLLDLILKRKTNIVVGHRYPRELVEGEKLVKNPNIITLDVELSNIYPNYSYIDDNGNFVSNKEAYEAEKIILEQEAYANGLRAKRKSLLEAFDLWEKAVLRGRATEDNIIMQWYYDLLDLKEEALDNVPEKIKYYLGGK